MKKLLLAIAIFFSLAEISAQSITVSTYDSATGFFPVRKRIPPLYTAGSISRLNDSTIFGAGGAMNTGWTNHGIAGTSSGQDFIIYKDTVNSFLGFNTTSPNGLFDIRAQFPGTVSVTNGSATVTGTGTQFKTTFKYGDSIYVNGTTYGVVLSTPTSNTSLTLSAVYSGSTASGQSYVNVAAARGVLRLDGNGIISQGGVLLSQNSLLFGNASWGFNSMPVVVPTGTANNGTRNAGFGVNSFKAMTRGYDNVAIGYNAADNLTTGAQNTLVGAWAGHSLGANVSNTAVGYFANVFGTGDGNTAIGWQAMQNATGSYNSSLGYQSGNGITGGGFNTAMGTNSMLAIAGGGNNVGVGYVALGSNVGGSSNAAIGDHALGTGNAGSNGVAIGAYALNANTASNNTTVGFHAASISTTATGIAALGYQVLNTNTTGSYNTAIGYQSTYQNTTGFGNTGLGYYSNNSYAAVTSFNISNGGSYTVAPSVSVANMSGSVTYTANLTGTAVTSISISGIPIWTGGGPATVTFTGGTGTGAVATAVLSSGSRNTSIGYQAGLKAGYGSANVYLGYDVEGVQNDSNKLFVDNTDLGTGSLIYGDFLNRKIKINGGFGTAYASTATSITLTAANHTLEVTATGQTETLPTAVGITGIEYTIKLTASGSATVATTSSQTIDGSTTYSLSAQYKYVTVQSNGANWLIIANN